MSVSQRGKDTWRIQVYTGKDASGKRTRYTETVHCRKKSEAKERERAILTSLDKGTYMAPVKLTAGELFQTWFETYAKAKCDLRTREGYESIIRQQLAPAFGHLTLREVSTEKVEAFYTRQLERVSGNTVWHYHRILSEILRYAVAKGLMARNPCDGVMNLPAYKKAQMRTLVPMELDALNAPTDDDYYYAPIYLAVNTGLRQGEVLALRWRDLDLDMGTITAARSLYKRKGLTVFKEPKNHKARMVALTPKLILFLKQYKALREEVYKEQDRTLGLDDLVFTSVRFDTLNPSVLSHAFSRMARKAGLAHVRFHDLRHTFASLSLRQGVPLKVVQEALGHYSMSFTADLYVTIIEGMQREAMDRLNETMPDGVKPSYPANFNTRLTPTLHMRS